MEQNTKIRVVKKVKWMPIMKVAHTHTTKIRISRCNHIENGVCVCVTTVWLFTAFSNEFVYVCVCVFGVAIVERVFSFGKWLQIAVCVCAARLSMSNKISLNRSCSTIDPNLMHNITLYTYGMVLVEPVSFHTRAVYIIFIINRRNSRMKPASY